MTIDLYYHPISGPVRTVLMTAKYLGIELNVKLVDIIAGDQRKPEFVQKNPQHAVPTLDDNGFYLWESRAICTYLVNKYFPESPLYPKDPKERAVVDRMLYFDIGTLSKAEGDYKYTLLKKQTPDPEKKKALDNALGFLEQFLSKTSYVAGDHLTIADIAILASLSYTDLYEYNLDGFPKITAWRNKMKLEIPDYKEINDVPLNQYKEILKARK